jgi:diketogulonate reductase-like aldo/keto reductase
VAFTPVARPGAIEKNDPFVTSVAPDWPDLRQNPYLQELAAKYGKSVPQIMLNWGLCHGHVVIPKAATHKFQLENQDIYDFQLTEEEVAKVDGLNTGRRLCNK